jgi:hypothetical protein
MIAGLGRAIPGDSSCSLVLRGGGGGSYAGVAGRFQTRAARYAEYLAADPRAPGR